MLLDERHSKELFAAVGIPIPPSVVIRPGEADRPDLVPPFDLPWILKSQVLSGGRGKAGGVVRVEGREDLPRLAARLFSLPLGGKLPPYLLIEPAVQLAREFYLSFAVSRDRESLVLTVKAAGGMDVEAGSASPALIQNIRLPEGPGEAQIRAAFFRLGLARELWAGFRAIVLGLYQAVADNGLLLAEINPLALTMEGRLMALDGKAEIDDSVVEARADLARFLEPDHFGRLELTARQAGFSYVPLEGWVGCVVNGAGLAMATMDGLNLAGLPAANFLDLGGAADESRIRAALGLLFEDDRVKAVLINLYGGILSCTQVATALLAVLGNSPPAKPIVARIAGNGAVQARELLLSRRIENLVLVPDMASALDSLARLGPRTEPFRLPKAAPAALSLPAVAIAPAYGRLCAGSISPLDFGPETRVLVQGLTGKTASFHAGLMAAYGTSIVAGVTPFKGGTMAGNIPIYDSVFEAVLRHTIDLSVVFVPGPVAAEAVREAADAGIPWIVCITEGIPQLDMLRVRAGLRERGTCLVGPNTPGVIVPGRFKAGIMPVDPFSPGPVAVFSRSGTLTYEASARLTGAGLGQALAVGVGGDPFIGLGYAELLEIVRDDPRVEAVLLLGEIGGRAEEDVAAYVAGTAFPKPVASFVAGLTAPPGRRMGHAGAILEEGDAGGGLARKLSALRGAGITICPSLDDVAQVMTALLGKR